MKNLKGENGDGDVGPLSDTTPWADNVMNYMVEERLRAWVRLFFNNISLDDQEITALFITSSRLTSEYLLEKFPDVERIFEFDSLNYKPPLLVGEPYIGGSKGGAASPLPRWWFKATTAEPSVTRKQSGVWGASLLPINNLKNDKIEGWHKHLIDTLDNLAKSRWSSSSNVVIQRPDRKGCGEKMALSLDIIPETSPIDFVSSLFPFNPNGMAENSIEPEFNHTIIGHLAL